jgi:WD40 repeat protein
MSQHRANQIRKHGHYSNLHKSGIVDCLLLTDPQQEYKQYLVSCSDASIHVQMKQEDGLELIQALQDHKLSTLYMNWNQKYFFSCGMDSMVNVYDIQWESKKLFKKIKSINVGLQNCWKIYPHPANVNYFVGTSKNGIVNVFDIEKEKKVVTYTHPKQKGFAMCLAFSHSGDMLAVGYQNGSVALFSVQSGKLISSFELYSMCVRDIKFSMDDSQFFTCSDDKNIRVYDTDTRKLIRTIQGHKSFVLTIDLNKQYLVSGSSDRTVRIWDMETYDSIHIAKDHSNQVNKVLISPNNKYIYSVSDDMSCICLQLPPS